MNSPAEGSRYFLAGRNINGYYAFQLFYNLNFWLPVYAVFFLARQLDYSTILILFAVSNAVQMILELPSGVLADRWGRRPVLMLGSLIHGVGYLCIAFGGGLPWYLAGMTLHGAGYAFVSGSDAALIYDSLIAAGREDEFKRIEGRAYMFNLIGWGAGGLIGGLLAAQNLALPYIVSAISSFMACLIMATCVEPPRRQRSPGIARFLRDAGRVIRHNCPVRSAVIFSAVIFGLLFVTHKFSQPYLQRAGISLELFGVIYFCWLMFAALSANFSEAVERRIGARLYFLALPILTGGVVVYLGLYQNWGGAALALIYQFTWGSLRPQINQIINQEVASSMRATILSVAGFGSSVVYILVGPIIGLAADRYDFPAALLYLGGIILIFGLAAGVYIIRHCRIVPDHVERRDFSYEE